MLSSSSSRYGPYGGSQKSEAGDGLLLSRSNMGTGDMGVFRSLKAWHESLKDRALDATIHSHATAIACRATSTSGMLAAVLQEIPQYSIRLA